jgi:hypothetical protein
MTCAGISEMKLARIVDSQECRDKTVEALGAQVTIHVIQQVRRAGDVRRMRVKDGVNNRYDKRGGRAVPGGVAYEHAPAGRRFYIVQREKVVQVAACEPAWLIAHRDFQAGNLRQWVWQKRALKLTDLPSISIDLPARAPQNSRKCLHQSPQTGALEHMTLDLGSDP